MIRFASAIIFASIFCLANSLLAMNSEQATKVVTAAYEDILNRKPDPSGLREYRSQLVDNGWTENQVRQALRESAEYKKKSTDTIIENAYQDLLNRRADSSGRKYLADKIVKDNWTEKNVRDWIRKSDEYKNKHN